MATYSAVVDRYYPLLKALQEQGKVRFIGATFQLKAEPRHETAVLALRNDPGLWDTIMLKYGFLNQWAAKGGVPAGHRTRSGHTQHGGRAAVAYPSATLSGGSSPMERRRLDRAG